MMTTIDEPLYVCIYVVKCGERS